MTGIFAINFQTLILHTCFFIKNLFTLGGVQQVMDRSFALERIKLVVRGNLVYSPSEPLVSMSLEKIVQ